MKKHDDLQTPSWVWQPLAPFDLDPCAGPTTQIGKTNYSIARGQDGLALPWRGFVFCNPPFSEKTRWIQRMIQHNHGILLLPERGSAPWFGPVAEAAGYYWVMGKKINFIGGPSSNNLGTVLFLFGEIARFRVIASSLPGHLVKVETFRPRP